MQFSYQNNLLERVEVNHPGRLVSFNYDNENRIIAIADFTGRVWKYTYDDMGDLAAVTTPSTQEYSKGLTTFYEYSSYQYSSTAVQHNLLRIIDASGQIYLENEYGTEPDLLSFNRVTRQRQGSGETYLEYEDVIEEFFFPYSSHQIPAHQTVETDRNGQQIRYLFNRFGNIVFREEYTRIDGIPKLISSHYRYNQDGNLVGTISPEGVITQFLYGRDYYERKLQIDEDYMATEDDNLTFQNRQSFNRLLASVKRGKYYNLNALSLSKGLWSSDVFPDIFDVADEDIIQKFVYEPEFGQPLSVSDPRNTKSANPDFTEDDLYQRQLTIYNYNAGNGFQRYLLKSVQTPVVTAPDGSVIGASVMQFTRYDSRGRLLESVGPEGLVSRLEYYDSNAGILEGMLHKSITDPDGLAIQNAVDLDSLGRVVKAYSSKYFDFTDGRFVTTAAYNELGQTVSATSTSPFDIITKRKYNRTGNLIEEITEVKNSANELVQDLFYKSKYKYDEEFNVVESVEGNLNDTQLRKIKYVYDASNRLAITISPAGRKSRVFYNDRSLPQKEVADYGGIGVNSKKFYDADGRVTRLIDPRGGTHRMKYDALGRIIETEDPSGNKSYATYDKIGNVLTERFFEYINDTTYTLLKRSEYHYNELGKIYIKGVNLFEYSNEVVSNPQAAYIETGPGKVLALSMYYDKGGRLVKTVDQSNRGTKHEYDKADRLVKQIDPYGNELTYQYDKAGNVTHMDKREVIKDVVSNEITGNRYFVTKQIYDELNRVTESIDSLGNKINFKYDSRGLLEKAIDPLSQVTSSVYDVFRRQLSNSKFLTDKDNASLKIPVTTAYQYDLDDMLLSQTDALGRLTTFQYNGLGKRVSSTLPDGTKDVSDFDFSGMVNSYKDRNGTIIHYARDVFGRIVRQDIDKSQLSHSVTLEGSAFSTFQFDGAGRLVEAANEFSSYSYKYNSLDWLVEENNIANPLLPNFIILPMKTGRSYDDNGALSVFTYPSGRKLQYQRDVLDRIIKIEQLSKGVGYPGDSNAPKQYEIASIQYEGLQRKQLHRNNGSSTDYKYDFGARVVEIKHSMNNTPFMQMQFLYDAVGNMRKKVELADDFQATSLYTYDELYRLNNIAKNEAAVIADFSVLHPYSNAIPEEIPFGQGIIDTLIDTLPAEKIYEYDLVGNRLTLATNNIQISNYLPPNNLDQYTKVDDTFFNYDKNGNLIDDTSFTYQYDFANRLTSVTRKLDNTKVLSYLYDTQGRKIFELKDGKIRQMVYNSINAIEEYENSIQDQSLVLDDEVDNLLQLGKSGHDLYLSSDLTSGMSHVN